MAKNNEKLWRAMRLVVPIAVILVTIGIAYGAIRQQLDTHDEEILRLRNDVKYIKETVDRIEGKVDKNARK